MHHLNFLMGTWKNYLTLLHLSIVVYKMDLKYLSHKVLWELIKDSIKHIGQYLEYSDSETLVFY
jgi:hypothetical protein